MSADGTVGQRGVFETFRYDALGRRVATLSQRGPNCVQSHTECFPYLERTVWDGDQLLYEIRASNYGGSSSPDLVAGGSYNAYGRVLYLHGGGIDTPLAVTRLSLNNQPAEVTTAPHADWQGDYVNGTLISGFIQGNCSGTSGCPIVTWPGGRQTTDGALLSDAPATTGWWGSLMQGQADASGLRYQRNRFYDPTTGQFTQQDPIGLAGGRNLYAFAGGDPINFRDPFGLCPPEKTGQPCTIGQGARELGRNFLAGLGATASGDFSETGPGWRLGALVGQIGLGYGVRSPVGQTVRGAAVVSTPTVSELLMPAGSPIGRAGSSVGFRELTGGIDEATSFFGQLSRGGTQIASKYPGTLMRLPDGGTVGLRTIMSRSPGTAATIDVNVSGVPIQKIKFNP